MKLWLPILALLYSLLWSGVSLSAQTLPPRVFLLNAQSLAKAKDQADPELLKLARTAADAGMKFAPVSVMDKPLTPPSGDKHDFVSMALYWWPNPKTKDGLPYVRRDGVTNPQGNDLDRFNLEHLDRTAYTLALGWYLTGDQRYAEHAALLIRTWFVDPATAMKPNLKYAAYVPGLNTGKESGVINGQSLAWTVDTVGLLAGSTAWTPADDAAMQAWFAKYYVWLTTSKRGMEEAATPHNHGSWYAVQAASIALFLGKGDDARRIGEGVRNHRIPDQIDSHGMQKYEMERTKSFSYSAYNLKALTQLAIIVEPLGIDLYKPLKAGDPGILTAVDTLSPYDQQHPWPHEQIVAGREGSLCPALNRAWAYTRNAKYQDAQKRFGCKPSAVTMVEALGMP